MLGDSVCVSTSKPNFLEITPSGTSKGKALAFLAGHLGFSLAQTLAFGDSLNDLSMLQACGTSVAMGNARCEVKAVCTFVAKTNNEDGVADFLEAHVLS